MKKKQPYLAPYAAAVVFEPDDIITLSGLNVSDEGNGENVYTDWRFEEESQ